MWWLTSVLIAPVSLRCKYHLELEATFCGGIVSLFSSALKYTTLFCHYCLADDLASLSLSCLKIDMKYNYLIKTTLKILDPFGSVKSIKPEARKNFTCAKDLH